MSNIIYKFSNELEKKYPTFKKTKVDHEALCTSCNVVISVAARGKSSLDQHLTTLKHKIKMQIDRTSKKMDSFVMQHTKLEDKKLSCESSQAVKHQSYESCEGPKKSCKRKCSDVSPKISSTQQTENIVTNMLAAPSSQRPLDSLEIINNIPFVGVCMDRFNQDTILFPISIQFFDKKLGITCKLIEMASVSDEVEAIYTVLTMTLEKTNLKEKCIAFAGDSCNTNFGSINKQGENSVFQHLQNNLQKPLINISCPAYILNNCVQYALDGLPIDIESVVLKIYNFFSVFTVRTDTLQDFCNVVEIDYKKLLFHSKTRWLFLFPAINKLLEIYPDLKSYFLSLDHAPVIIINFLENPLNEVYLWFIHSLMYIFHTKIESIENENHSVLEIRRILCSVEARLTERKEQAFLPLKVKQIIEENEHNFRSKAMKEVLLHVYERGIRYLQKWIPSFNEFNIFEWMLLESKPLWDNIAECVEYLTKMGVKIDDSALFDQCMNLNEFFDDTEYIEEFLKKSADLKWVVYFSQRTEQASSEFLKMCSFFFAIPAHNMNTKKFF